MQLPPSTPPRPSVRRRNAHTLPMQEDMELRHPWRRHHRLSRSHWGCTPLRPPLALALWPLALLLCQAGPASAMQVVNGISYKQCAVPPKILREKTGATVQSVLGLCIKTDNGLAATLDNADRFFIGNSSKFRDLGTACYSISLVYNVLTGTTPGTYTFLRAPELPPEFTQQSWDLTLWPKYNPNLKQQVNLTVSNFGGTDLQLTGLPKSVQTAVGNVTTVQFDYSQIKLIFNTLPVLQQYLFDPSANELNEGITGLVLVQTPTNPTSSTITVTYALVSYDPGNPLEEYNFLLYESTFTPESVKMRSGGRRLLVAAASNKAPASACSGAKCSPASPLPKTCKPKGGVNYPACLKKCSCFSK